MVIFTKIVNNYEFKLKRYRCRQTISWCMCNLNNEYYDYIYYLQNCIR